MDNSIEEHGAISLTKALEVMRRRWWIYLVVVIVIPLLTGLVTLLLPDRYESKAVLVPNQENKSSPSDIFGSNPLLKSAATQVLGASGLGGGVDETVLALETMKSHKFISGLIARHKILAPLMAASSWNPITGKLTFDKSVYDPEKEQWTRDVAPPLKPKPDDEEAVKEFKKHLNVELDPDTRIVTVKYESVSPYLAKQWIEWMVDDVNAMRRQEVRAEKEKMLGFLHQRLAETVDAELRRTISALIGENLKAVMVLEARKDYVFRVLDPPIAPVKPTGPKRLVIVLLSFLATLVLIMMAVLIEARLRQERPGNES